MTNNETLKAPLTTAIESILTLGSISKSKLFRDFQETQPKELKGVLDVTQEIFDEIISNLVASGKAVEKDDILSLSKTPSELELVRERVRENMFLAGKLDRLLQTKETFHNLIVAVEEYLVYYPEAISDYENIVIKPLLKEFPELFSI